MAIEKARGQFVISKNALRTLTDTLSQEYAAFRTRDLSGDDVAYLCIDTVYEPLRRWGSKTGVRCVWGIGVDGRKVLLCLSTTQSESDERCLGGRRERSTRGLQTPVTITTDGGPGLLKATESAPTRGRHSKPSSLTCAMPQPLRRAIATASAWSTSISAPFLQRVAV